MNELNQHKKSDYIKWIIAFVALILLAVSVVALGTQAFGEEVINKPTTVNAPETKTDETPVDPLVPIEPTDAIQPVSTFNIVNSDNMKLMAKAPASYAAKQTNTVELNATAYPIGSENGGFVWSAKWANPNSAFASGKNVYNYIGLEGDTGSSTQYVTALQPFGEQIIITVSTVFNPNAVATCTVDYTEKWADTQYLETYTDVFIQENSIYVDDGRTMGYNDKTIDLSDTFDLNSYDSNHSWWDKLWDYGFSWPATNGDYKDVAPIYEVKASDFSGSDADISARLLVNSADVTDLKNFYNKETQAGNRVVLFRFANTDYYCAPAFTPNTTTIQSTDTYVAQETLFLDFDIIELTFYFNDMAKKTNIGLDDYLEYETERATVAELKLQNSYFINALYKNAGSN